MLGLCILLIDWLSFGERQGAGGESFEIGGSSSRGWKNFGRRWARGVGGLENWTIFTDVIRVPSLTRSLHFFNIKQLLRERQFT